MKRGDIVKVGKTKWIVFALSDSFTIYVYKFGSKGNKAYVMTPTDLEWSGQVEVYQINGSGAKIGGMVASGKHAVCGHETF